MGCTAAGRVGSEVGAWFFGGVSESDTLCLKSFGTAHSCKFIIMESINTFEPKCCAGRRRLFKWAFVRSSSLILPNWMYLAMSNVVHKVKYFLYANACLHGLSYTEVTSWNNRSLFTLTFGHNSYPIGLEEAHYMQANTWSVSNLLVAKLKFYREEII